MTTIDAYEIADRLYENTEVRQNWSQPSLRTWILEKCRCAYCDTDLLSTRGTCYCYFSEDHLLPKSLYPELEFERENLILCCRHCNLLKLNYDPNKDGQPIYTEAENRKLDRKQIDELKKRARCYVQREKQRLEPSFEKAKELITETLRANG